jgi:hypothetical protein
MSILAYIGFFILPTAFGAQVVSAPSSQAAQKTSLYYVKHITQEDVRAGDVLLYIDHVGNTQTTSATKSAVGDTIATQAGNVKYTQTLGVAQKEIKSLGAFYKHNLTAEGRWQMVIFVGVVFGLNYLLSYLVPQKVEKQDTSEAEQEVPTVDGVAPVKEEVAVSTLTDDQTAKVEVVSPDSVAPEDASKQSKAPKEAKKAKFSINRVKKSKHTRKGGKHDAKRQ